MQVQRILESGIRNFYTLAVVLGQASAAILSSINRGGRAEESVDTCLLFANGLPRPSEEDNSDNEFREMCESQR